MVDGLWLRIESTINANTMRQIMYYSIIIVILALLEIFAMGIDSNVRDADSKSVPPIDIDAIRRALQSDALLRPYTPKTFRAVQLLGLTGKTNESARGCLIDVLFSTNVNSIEVETAFWVSQIGSDAFGDIQKRILSEAKINFPILLCVAQIKQPDPKLRDYLRAICAKPDKMKNFVPLLEICLANMGDDSRKHEESLMRRLSPPSTQIAQVHSFLAVTTPKWTASEPFLDLLALNLKNTNIDGAHLAMAVAQLPQYESRFASFARDKYNQESRAVYKLIYGMSLAKGLVKEREQYLINTTALLGSDNVDHVMQSQAILIAYRLLDQDLIHRIIDLISDRNDEVCLGAIRWVNHLGLRATDAFSSLVHILRSSRDPRIRNAAAHAIGFVAPANNVDTVEQLLLEAKDEFIQKGLKESISLIRLH